MCRIRCLPAGVRCVETPRVSEFPVDFNFPRLFLCKTLLPHMTYPFCADTNAVLPPSIVHTQVLKAAIEEKCSCTYVYTVRLQMEVPVYGLGGGFEWLWLHFGMWRRVLWVVCANLLPPPSGCTLFLAFQFIGFIVSALSHPRHRSNVRMSCQESDNSLRRRPPVSRLSLPQG